MSKGSKSRESRSGFSRRILQLLVESGNFVLENRKICKMGDRFYIELPKDYNELWMYLWKRDTKLTIYLEWKQGNE